MQITSLKIRSMMVPLVTVALALVVSACGGGGYMGGPPTGSGPEEYKVGKPYKIGGTWYTPREDPFYDEVGNASWYGRDFHGKKTANGERYDMNALTAAHTTLPLPSFVRVTNLSNGRNIVVRINDRGPFAKGRIIDMSRRGAQLLGFEKKGVQRVRVQAVRRDGSAVRRMAERRSPPSTPTRVTPAPSVSRQAPPDGYSGASGMPLFVQIGSYSSSDTARGLVAKLGGLGPVLIQAAVVGGRTVWRLRIGPFKEAVAAHTVLEAVRLRGFGEARVFTQQQIG